MGFLSGIFKSKAKDWIYTKLDDDQVPSSVESKIIESRKFYLEIWLRSLRIVNVRKGFNKFYPVVHSYVSIPHLGSSKPAEFNMATRPTKLEELNPKNIDRLITLNKVMLDKIPYQGGNIDLDIGLYSIKSEDLAGPYLSLLESISSKAGVSFVSQALQFAEPLKTGINLITGGNDDSIFEIGLSTTFEGENLKSGYYIVIRAQKEDLDVRKILVNPSDNKLLYNGKNIEDYPYLVFEIKTSVKKENWWMIDDIDKAYNELKLAVNSVDEDNITEAFNVFKRIVRTSSDLLNVDKLNIIKIIEEDLITPMFITKKYVSKKNFKVKDLKDYDIYFK